MQARGHPEISSGAVHVMIFCIPLVVPGAVFTGIKFPVHEPEAGDKDERDAKGKGKTMVAMKGKSVPVPASRPERAQHRQR